MKYLRSVDFAGQSIIFLLLIGFCTTILFTAPLEWDGYLLGILYAQLFLGPWQMASAIITWLAKANLNGQRKIHLITSIFCLVGCAASAWFHDAYSNSITKSIGVIFFIIIPWVLAFFYYAIIWRWMFPKQYTGKFLSHINF